METSARSKILLEAKRNSKRRGYASGQKSVIGRRRPMQDRELPVVGIEVEGHFFDRLS
jgi:hypothetical protein